MCYNIFNQLHSPLKHASLKACIDLESDANTTKENRERSISRVSEVLIIFKEQIKQEEYFVLPLVFEYEPSIWDIYVGQHGNLHKQSGHLEILMNTYKSENEENKKSNLFKIICEVFNEFVLMNYHHMDDEEKILSEILERYYSDDFLRQIDHQIKMQTLLIAQQNNSIYSTATAA